MTLTSSAGGSSSFGSSCRTIADRLENAVGVRPSRQWIRTCLDELLRTAAAPGNAGSGNDAEAQAASVLDQILVHDLRDVVRDFDDNDNDDGTTNGVRQSSSASSDASASASDNPQRLLRKAIHESMLERTRYKSEIGGVDGTSNGDDASSFKLMVQIEEAVDMSKNVESRLGGGNAGGGVNNDGNGYGGGNGHGGGGPAGGTTSGSRCLKMCLSDGYHADGGTTRSSTHHDSSTTENRPPTHHHAPTGNNNDATTSFFAVEIEPIQRLNSCPEGGTKLVLTGPIVVRRGVLLLHSGNAVVIGSGGGVPEMVLVQREAIEAAKKSLGVGVDPTVRALIGAGGVGSNNEADDADDEGEHESGDVVVAAAQPPPRAPAVPPAAPFAQQNPTPPQRHHQPSYNSAQQQQQQQQQQPRATTTAAAPHHREPQLQQQQLQNPYHHQQRQSSRQAVAASTVQSGGGGRRNAMTTSSVNPYMNGGSSSRRPQQQRSSPVPTMPMQQPLPQQQQSSSSVEAVASPIPRHHRQLVPSTTESAAAAAPPPRTVEATRGGGRAGSSTAAQGLNEEFITFSALRNLLLRARSDKELYRDLYENNKVWIVNNMKQSGKKLHFNIEKRASNNVNSGSGNSTKSSQESATAANGQKRKYEYVMIVRMVDGNITAGGGGGGLTTPDGDKGAAGESITCRVASSIMEPFFDLSPSEMRKLSKKDKERSKSYVREGGSRLIHFTSMPHRYRITLELSPAEFFRQENNNGGDALHLDGDVAILCLHSTTDDV